MSPSEWVGTWSEREPCVKGKKNEALVRTETYGASIGNASNRMPVGYVIVRMIFLVVTLFLSK